MKQLRKTEWRRGYPIKKNLALCAWGMLALAGFAGILARPENIPSLAACVLALAGAVLTLPRLLRYYRTTYQSLPALNRRFTKEEQEELIEQENFETITELKTESMRWTDFAESVHWLRINGRYVPKELVILGGAEVTYSVMNRDTTPLIFLYATGDMVKIDLGVQVSVQKIRELNALPGAALTVSVRGNTNPWYSLKNSLQHPCKHRFYSFQNPRRIFPLPNLILTRRTRYEGNNL